MIYYRGNKLRAPTLRLSGEYQVFAGSAERSLGACCAKRKVRAAKDTAVANGDRG